MKKQFIFCGLAAAIGAAAFATTEKIHFLKDNELLKSIYVENIDHISYIGSDEESGYEVLELTTLDGITYAFPMDDFDEIHYQNALPETPIEIAIEPHHRCATLNITAHDEEAYYRVSGVPASMLADYDHLEWAEIIMEADIAYINSVAEYYDQPLSDFPLSMIFEQGSQVRDWFPQTIISDDTPIALVVYSATIEDDQVKVLTDPRLYEFNTKKLEEIPVEFNLSIDATSTSLTVNAETVDSDIPFAIELYSADQVAASGLINLMAQSAANYENMVYTYGMSWDDFSYRNSGSRSYTNRRMGDKWVAVVFGMEYGVVTTAPVTQEITIPAPVITNDCTFEVTTEQISSSEMRLDIVPSSDATRYVAFLIESSKLGDNLSAAQHVANRIYWFNYTNQIIWETSEYVHTGASSLSTHDDVVDGMYLEADKEYTVLICGILDDGTRTTEIKEVSMKTSAPVVEEFTFDVQFSDFNASNAWTHFINYTITPSDPEAKYVVAFLPETNTYADLSVSDEEFIQRYVNVQGQYLEVYNGTLEKKAPMSSNWSSAAGGYVFGKYILAIFGYDGQATTPLYAYSVDGETGETEKLRGPENTSDTPVEEDSAE